MKTAQIKGEVKWSVNSPKVRCISNQKIRLNAGIRDLLPGKFDGTRGEIHADHFPTCVGESDDVSPGAAADVDGTTGFVVFDEIEEFRGTDTCIPGRLPEIQVLEKKAAEQGLHVRKSQPANEISRRRY